ncbi:hypothetical protein FPOAC1_003983 [Fusarium poae]|uniref:hypothetical protein n=1 Tax=Fusarium poae TaxID=36050 RepID=UPI001CE82BC9|nr:hypothetical protein FPOAC1_003983 [Fusarium poae]KAG8670749.1 hypothetical protein FPOAC1_003983 [Fusarium poae]
MIVIILKGDTLSKKTLIVVEALADDMAAQHKQLRQYVDGVPEEELGPLAPCMPGLRNFHGTYFGGIAGLSSSNIPKGWPKMRTRTTR